MPEKKRKKPGGTPKGVKAMRIDLTEEQIEMCAKYAAVGLNLNQMAALCDVSTTTFDEILKREPHIARAIEKGRSRGIGKMAQTLFQQAEGGNTTALIFYLKTRARWAEAREPEEVRAITLSVDNVGELSRVARSALMSND